MTTGNNTGTLIKLSDSDTMLSTTAEDVRGHKVVDKDSNDLGKVDALLVDEEKGKVRMLRVAHGGILGIGTTTSFIPVEAITSIDDNVVCVSQTRGQVSHAPHYDPELVSPAEYYGEVYRHYGYKPDWSAGDVDRTDQPPQP